MRIAARILIALVACAALSTPSVADVPTNMNVQGILTDGAGDPLPAGLKDFTFKIFDQAVGGTEIWPAGPGEMQTLATDADGLWKAAVGANVALTSAVFQDTSRWLEVTVDDGVNPPETLPRMKLNTVPYAYAAETIGGATLDDLRDVFVDVPGDSMTGRLILDAPHKNLPGSSFRTNNISDANAPEAVIGNTIAVLADAKSDGFEGKYAVVGYADGATGSTVAVYGEARGSGAFSVGLYGTVAKTAAQNFSGYFYGGDFSVTNPDTPGDSAVRLPNDAISNSEILDEPGLAANASNSTFNGLTGTMADLITVTMTIPRDGYILVEGNFYGWISGSNTSSATGYAQIDETAGGGLILPYVRAFGELQPNTSGNRFYPVCASRVFFKTAGTYTFRLEAEAASVSGTGTVNASYPFIAATYYPHAYGAVTTVLAASDATGFSESRSVASAPLAGAADDVDHPQEPMVSVDLRELELRALRVRAEAERAERELVEAQLRLGPARDTGEE